MIDVLLSGSGFRKKTHLCCELALYHLLYHGVCDDKLKENCKFPVPVQINFSLTVKSFGLQSFCGIKSGAQLGGRGRGPWKIGESALILGKKVLIVSILGLNLAYKM